MPARVSRANTAAATQTAPKKGKNKNRQRSLNAYAQAQKQLPEQRAKRQHRLGEVEDDEPRRKRRRDDEDGEEDADDEEQPQRKKSSKRSERNGDPDVEYGSDSSGNEWTLGGLGEDDDDSDLDSEEAFGDSDEEKFSGFTFRGSKSGKKSMKRRTKSDLNEAEDSDEDDGDSQDDEGLGLGDDAVDLAAMLDDDEEEPPTGKDKTTRESDEDSASEEEDDEDDEDGSSDSESEDDEQVDDEERVARMRDRLEALDAPKRQTTATQPAAAATIDDFLEDTGLEFEKPTSRKKKSQQSTTISAPLPKRQQDKIDREVATQKATEQLDRWRDTVIRNRRAEFLNFPLQGSSGEARSTGKEKFMPANEQAPQNQLEESIQRIMEESGLAPKQKAEEGDDFGDEETALMKAEGLAEKKLPVEEVLRRRAELRRTRELLFREEIKAKRIAKIKSKSYRKVHRKERMRDADREKQMLEDMGIDPMDEDDKERADRKRAEARMGTKHKDSKWAKSLKQTNRTAWDDSARDGVVEQARRAEDLKKRIAGHDISDDDSDLPSDDEGQDDHEFLDQVRGAKVAPVGEKKGLASLKFMKDADERKRKANEEDAERLRKEMAIADGDEVESEEEEQNLGRAIFGPQSKEKKSQPKPQRLEFEAPEDQSGNEQGDDDLDVNIVTEKQQLKTRPKVNGAAKTITASGPLARGVSEDQAPKNAWLKAPKGSKKKQEAVESILDVTIPESVAKRSAKASAVAKTVASNTDAASSEGWTTVKYGVDAGVSDTEEHSDPVLSAKEATQSLQQRAFAGDDVQAAFDAEKADLAESEDEKEVSNHLPGWGSWTGDGLSKSIRKANQRAKHNPLFKTKLPGGVKQADRKDAVLDNVIISEKQDRKGKKYLASELPHGYETGQQYERSRRLPMGPEWTTKEVHQRMTRPRVVVKKGINVQALERPVA